MKKTPGTKVQVTGGGSGAGLAALQNGTTEIARRPAARWDAEKNKLRTCHNTTGVEIPVAKDGVTYVSESNLVNALTVEQTARHLRGDITTGSRWGPDAPIIIHS